MGRKGSKKKDESGGGDKSQNPFQSPFSGLEGLRESLPPGEKPRDEAPEEAGQGGGAATSRAVVRYERKGRGGKEVTLVEKLGVPAGELVEWLKALKRQLGCGGSVEGDVLVLQGDQRERLPRLLEKRGVRRVSVS